MLKFKTTFIIFFLFTLLCKNTLSLENKILFTVDNDIITSIDIYNEINYLKALNKNLEKLEKNKIFEIAKNSLINEIIKTKELSKYSDKLVIDDKYLIPFITNIYDGLDIISLEAFKNYLSFFNVDLEIVKKKISLEIIWNDLIFSKFSKNIKIDKDDIRNKLKNDSSRSVKEFLLSEIVFKVPENSDLKTQEIIINNIINEKGFENAALIHSISGTAQKNSGLIGWINENSLNLEIKKKLENLEIGNHTTPILIPGGFLILKINNIRIIENEKFDINKKVEEIIKIKTTEQLNNFSNIYFDKIKQEYKINAK